MVAWDAANGLEDDVRTDVIGTGHDFVDWITLSRVDRIEPPVGRQFEFFGRDVDDKYLLGSLRQRELCTLRPNHTGADHCHDVSRLNVAVPHTEHRARQRLERRDL